MTDRNLLGRRLTVLPLYAALACTTATYARQASAAEPVARAARSANAPVDDARLDAPSALVHAPPLRDGNALTIDNATRLDLKRGITLDLAPAARAEAKFTSKLPIGARGALIYVENVEVSTGRVDATAPNDSTAGVLLQGAGGVQAITAKGRLSMVVGADHVAVATWDNPALVGQNGSFKALPPNTVRTFDLKSGQSVDRPRLAASTARSSGLGFSLGGEVPVVLEAAGDPSAKSYCGFLFDGTGAKVDSSCGHSNPKQLLLTAPSAGTFWGAVAAVDSDGFAGALSQPVLVRVLGLNKPHEVKNGAVLLGPGEKAELVGYEGLIMRYGTSPEYYPASSTVAMFERKPTSIEFRNPERPSEYAILNLSPRLLKSRIQIGPAWGTWPENEVKIAVQMWDGDGQALETLDDYRVVTRVGLEPVDVDFSQHGTQLVGTLEPQAGPGPWVVRVSILDSAGNEVSRDFLEVTNSDDKADANMVTGKALETARTTFDAKTAHR